MYKKIFMCASKLDHTGAWLLIPEYRQSNAPLVCTENYHDYSGKGPFITEHPKG